MVKKTQQFWDKPLLDKLHMISNFYYLLKGIAFYRFLFRTFGTGSYIRNPLLILGARSISVGRNVRIRDGVRLEIVDSGSNPKPELSIGDNTNIEQNVHIVCHHRIYIGANVSITGNCAIVDVIHPFTDVFDMSKIGGRIMDQSSFVEIGEGCFIGMGTVILPNVKLGKRAIIGANSVVTGDIPAYALAAGAPAVVLKQYDFQTKEWVRVTKTDSRA
jgi:acetyltransferase-like isoleucine patch superfamily enzyme